MQSVLARTLLVLAAAITSVTAAALDIPDRRRDQFAGEFSYYLYPIAGDIPGLGSAAGLGGSALNIAGSETDFTAFKVDGDFRASGYTLLDLGLIRHRLVADVGVYDFDVVQNIYGRGIDSSSIDYILPHFEGKYALGQLTLTFDERRYESYVRLLHGSSRTLDVRDSSGQAFTTVDTSRHEAQVVTLGGSIDYTGDRLDPRRGLRFEAAAKKPYIRDALASEFVVTDLNLTGFLPMRRRDSLVLNVFRSDAHVTRKGETDFATLQAARGLNCAALPVAQQADCFAIESRFLNEAIAQNRYGTATSLGGTQRLRSFDNGRYYAAHALSYGAEYRWNLTDEYTPFNIYIAKGVRTGLQLAFFIERGVVSEQAHDLWSWDKQRTSYGLGFRVILSGVVLRGDWATGNEGSQFQFFITYPWSMFSVDNPG